MWPFRKRAPERPDPIIIDGVRAQVCSVTDQWEFQIDGLDFTLRESVKFDERAVLAARYAANAFIEIRGAIEAAVRDAVQPWTEDGLNPEAADLHTLSVLEEEDPELWCATYCGDDSWGSLGYDVSVRGTQIVAVDGGD